VRRVKQEMLSPDPIVRARAEETLAAMISSALDESETEGPGSEAA
jgi:hypothetical protein